MSIAWTKEIIPSAWQRIGAIFIPKELNSKTFAEFRSVAILNIARKMSLSIMSR